MRIHPSVLDEDRDDPSCSYEENDGTKDRPDGAVLWVAIPFEEQPDRDQGQDSYLRTILDDLHPVRS